MRIKHIVSTLLFSALAIILASITIGRQIYYQRQPDIISFSLIHFAGYLFFLLMPVEILFTYYLVENYNVFILLAVALATAIVAQTIDYLVGKLVSNQIIHKFIGMKKYKKTEDYINKYGNLTVFVFNVLPLSSPILALVAGMLRYRFRNLVLYSFLGLSIKYGIIALIFLKF
jgi:membrane protein DedA with SNARE-associated domain